MSLVKRGQFFTIYSNAILDLDVTPVELIIFSIIYQMSQVEDHTFHGSIQYLADYAKVSKSTAIRALQSLEEKGYIAKFEKYKNGVKFCEYIATYVEYDGKFVGRSFALMNGWEPKQL